MPARSGFEVFIVTKIEQCLDVFVRHKYDIAAVAAAAAVRPAAPVELIAIKAVAAVAAFTCLKVVRRYWTGSREVPGSLSISLSSSDARIFCRLSFIRESFPFS